MALNIGDTAPEFITKDQDGKEVKLSDFAGKKVVLYFYPKDMTSGCTAEACNLRDNYKVLQKQGYEVLGVSRDDEKMHRKFIEKENLPFRLLADTDLSVHHKYGTWIEKSMYGRKYMGTARVTFVIDNGTITDLIGKVDTGNHAAQILGNKLPPKANAAQKQKPAKKAAKKTVKKSLKKSPKKSPSKKAAKRKK
ncbi:MAG TPA: thioredoxin-dependent thiol peroxidase [Cyclobacteriaceae bacterium]|jgi:peroxiredoxin Q/BCP|nr:thioredoxin-dependent thiol peroxidase [Cyclobacteriaceae bacterium]